MAVFTEVTTFTVVHCWNCGVPFGITDDFERRRRQDHQGFACPTGHWNYYSQKSEAEELKEQIAAKDREIAAQRSRVEAEQKRVTEARAQRDAVQRSLSATKAVVTRTKKKIVAGRCPCCSFKVKDLAIHMKVEHPNYDPEKAATAIEAKGL